MRRFGFGRPTVRTRKMSHHLESRRWCFWDTRMVFPSLMWTGHGMGAQYLARVGMVRYDCGTHRLWARMASCSMAVVSSRSSSNGKRHCTLSVDRSVPPCTRRWLFLEPRRCHLPKLEVRHYQSIVDMHHPHLSGLSRLLRVGTTLPPRGQITLPESGPPIEPHPSEFCAGM